jgi:hypothetical protein
VKIGNFNGEVCSGDIIDVKFGHKPIVVQIPVVIS